MYYSKGCLVKRRTEDRICQQEVFIIRALNLNKRIRGHIMLGKYAYFPEEMIGKRIRIRITEVKP